MVQWNITNLNPFIKDWRKKKKVEILINMLEKQ